MMSNITVLDRLTKEYEDYLEYLGSNFCYHEALGHIYRIGDKYCYENQTRFNESVYGTDLSLKRGALVAEINRQIKAGTQGLEPLEKISPFHIAIQHMHRVEQKVYVFGEAALLRDYEVDGCTYKCLNMYIPSILQPVQASDDDISVWLSHVRGLAREKSDVLLDWFAWIVQNPKKKMRWAPLLISEEGVGKDICVRALYDIFGRHNIEEIYPAQLDGNFNPYDKRKLIVVNEMKSSNRYDLHEKLKPKISGTGSGMVLINDKNEKFVKARNVSAWMIFSQYANAISIPAKDRRFWPMQAHRVVERNSPEHRAYFAALDDFYEKEHGSAKVYGWLKARQISPKFDANDPPAADDFKKAVSREGLCEVAGWVADQCDCGRWQGRTIITAAEIQEQADIELSGNLRVTTHKITQGVTLEDFVSLGSHPLEGGSAPGRKKTTWYARSAVVARLGGAFCSAYRDELLPQIPTAMRQKLVGKLRAVS